jgi:hypothetical protein
MAEEDPDRDVQRFLLENVESYEQLQSLLLIAKAPDRKWTAQQVAESSGLTLASAQAVLEHLARRRLLVCRSEGDALVHEYRSDQDEVVRRLERISASQLHVVLSWMNANALERVRSEAIKTFADAFLMGKKKKPDG